MGYLSERVSYLRGLADGLSLNKESAESRLFDEIIELLDDISSSPITITFLAFNLSAYLNCAFKLRPTRSVSTFSPVFLKLSAS